MPFHTRHLGGQVERQMQQHLDRTSVVLVLGSTTVVCSSLSSNTCLCPSPSYSFYSSLAPIVPVHLNQEPPMGPSPACPSGQVHTSAHCLPGGLFANLTSLLVLPKSPVQNHTSLLSPSHLLVILPPRNCQCMTCLMRISLLVCTCVHGLLLFLPL